MANVASAAVSDTVRVSEILENPHGNCALGGVNAALSALNGAVQIYHTGPGCCMQTTAGEAGQAGGRVPLISGVQIPCSNMLERDVVLGGIEKLDTHVAGAIEIIRGDAYFILTGCTAGIIGDDVESLAKRYRDAGHPVYAVQSAGFLGESYHGYEIAVKALLDSIVEPEPREKRQDLVNVLGILPYHDPFWEGNFEEIRRLLGKLGLEANTFFGQDEGVDAVRSSSRAALNIVLSPWLLKDAMEEYKSRFAIPALRFPFVPVGAADTAAFLRGVGKALGREAQAEQAIAEEERYFYHYLESAIGVQSWKRYAVVGESANVAGLTRFLANEYSFAPEVSIVTDPVPVGEDREYLAAALRDLDYAKPPEVVFTGDQWEINQALSRFPELSLVVGSTNEREYATQRNIQFLVASYPNTERLIFNRAIAGYRGALAFLEDLYSNT